MQSSSERSWQEANQIYLKRQIQRLRLLLHRRVLWLRQQWQQDSLESYQGFAIGEAQADRLLQGEDRQAEAYFYQENPQAVAIGQVLTELERDLTAQVGAMTEAGMPPALEVLAHLFNLSPFDRHVLLLSLVPKLDPAFERLYAYIQDDATRRYATPHLSLTLWGDEEEARLSARNSFLPESPLRHFRLVILDSGSSLPATHPSSCPLHLDERLANYLQGVNRLDEGVANLLRPVLGAPLATAHRAVVDRLEHWLAPERRQGSWAVINLIGPSGVGKRVVAQALCDRLGFQVYRLELTRLLARESEQQELLRLLEREAILLQFALYLDLTDLDPTDKATTTAIIDLIEHLGAFLIVGTREQLRLERKSLAVPVPKLDANTQQALWQQALAGCKHSLNGQLQAIAQQFDFAPQVIPQVVVAARNRARLRSADADTELTAEDLWQACRDQAGLPLNDLAQRLSPTGTWDDIVLPEDTFCQLQEIAEQVAHRPQVYETWGFNARVHRGRGINALFAGPSGTGKTMAAEILAQHLKLDLYRIDLAGVVSKYIGETEKNLRRVFDAAEQSGAILFFDEADALFGKRTEVKDSHDRYANIEVNYLLQRMEDYQGLAILATNRKSSLDWAFLRRLRFLVDFPLPDTYSRRRIWQKVFPLEAEVDRLDYNFLAQLEIPGGNIKNITLNAAFLAASEGVPINMAHIMHAARREYTKMDQLLTQVEFGAVYEVKP